MRVLALLLPLVVLAGCVGPPVVTPVPTPTATPVFASDEEALAAAEEAYAAYLAVSDEVASDGGIGVERLEAYVTASQLEQARTDFGSLQKSGRRMVGSSAFDGIVLQSFDATRLTVYLCLDVSGVRVFDGAGVDVTPVGRIARVPLEVGFAVHEALLLDSSEVWNGGSVCG